MPGKAGIGEPDMLAAVILDIRDQQDLRETRKQVFPDNMNFEFAKPTTEFDMPLV